MLALLLPWRLTYATVLPTPPPDPRTIGDVANLLSAVAAHGCISAVPSRFGTENFLLRSPFLFLPKNMLCEKCIRSVAIITFIGRHRCLCSEIATSCIVGDHGSYMLMSTPYMEIFRSPVGRKPCIVGDHASYTNVCVIYGNIRVDTGREYSGASRQ